MSIPLKYRTNHNIYRKWIISKYPDVANIVWGTTGKPITHTETKVTEFAKKSKGKILRVLKGSKPTFLNKNIMTPYDYWFANYGDIQEHYNHLFKQLINLVEDKELNEDICYLFEYGVAREKMQVLTLLLCIRNLHINC